MREEVIESDSFQEIVYESSRLFANKTGEGQYYVTMEGGLALHGLTRNQPAPVGISLSAWGQ